MRGMHMFTDLLLKVAMILPPKVQKFAAEKVLDYVFTRIAPIDVSGAENLPEPGVPAIFVCNHLSNLDGPVIRRVLKRQDPYFVAGMKLDNVSLTSMFKNIFKSVDIKPNSPDKEAMKAILGHLKEGESIMIFPEGTRSRSYSLQEGKRGILLIARLSGVPIVPMALTGTDKVLPINPEGEMGAEKVHKGKISLVVGKPFNLPLKLQDESKEDFEKRSMDAIMLSIARMLPKEYRGIYA
jgi:1-acyl-sn-glycerol-3-phosphate acyltransferase